MLNFYFKIKSLWFERGIVNKISDKGFILYCLLQQYRYDLIPNTAMISINMLYGEMKSLVNIRNKDEIITLLNRLKENKVISFDNIVDNNIPVMFIFTDTPNTHRVEKDGKMVDEPDSIDDMYLVIDIKTLNYIIEQGLSIKHFITFLAVKKYTYAQQNTVSCKTISEWTGLGKRQINEKYLIDLEKIGLIKNKISDNALGHRQNNFKFAKEYKDIEKEIYENKKESIPTEICKNNNNDSSTNNYNTKTPIFGGIYKNIAI